MISYMAITCHMSHVTQKDIKDSRIMMLSYMSAVYNIYSL